jgi:hypothetical protein
VKVDFEVDDSKIKRDIAARLQTVVTDEFNKVATNLLSDNSFYGQKLGPVRAQIRKHVEDLVLSAMTDERVQEDVQKLYNKVYEQEYQDALAYAIKRAARKQAQKDVDKLRRTPIQQV